MTKKTHIAVVLGMHRSGTSALTRALVALGFNIGEHLLAANDYNQKGYWEDQDIVVFNDRLLQILDSTYDSLTLIPNNVLDNPKIAALTQEAIDLLATKIVNSELWVIKDPRMCRLLSFWQPVFKQLFSKITYVISVRNPLSVADSLQVRDHFSLQKSLLLWLEHNVAAVNATHTEHRVFINYDNLLNQPQAELLRLASFLDKSENQFKIEWDRYIDSFLTSKLRHAQYNEDDLKLSSDVSAHVLTTYNLLQSACKANEIVNDKAFIEQWQKLEKTLEGEAPLLAYIQKNEALVHKRKVNPAEQIITSTLYWRPESNSHFVELNTIEKDCLLTHELQRVTFDFPLCMTDVKGIRFDMTDCPAAIDLHAMQLYDTDNQMVWQWDGGKTTFLGMSADLLLYDDSEQKQLMLISVGNDPFIHIALPKDILSAIKPGWQFVVEMTINSLSTRTAELLALLNKQDQQLKNQQNQCITLEGQQENLKAMHEQCYQEIKRAETQLDFLQNLTSI